MLEFFWSAIRTASSAVREALRARVPTSSVGAARTRTARVSSATDRIGGGSPWGPRPMARSRGVVVVRGEGVRGVAEAPRRGAEQRRERGREHDEREVERDEHPGDVAPRRPRERRRAEDDDGKVPRGER